MVDPEGAGVCVLDRASVTEELLTDDEPAWALLVSRRATLLSAVARWGPHEAPP